MIIMDNIQLKPYQSYYTNTPEGFINVQPAYAVMVHGDDVRFTLRLPKIPANIYNKIVSLFKKYAQLYNVECLARIFWDINEEKYNLVIPSQHASLTSVYPLQQEYDDWLISHIPVLEVHSHGIAFSAFFSSVDDADEIMRNQMYGVFSFQKGINAVEDNLFRVCNGSPDRVISIQKESLFEDSGFEYDASFVRSIMEREKIKM